MDKIPNEELKNSNVVHVIYKFLNFCFANQCLPSVHGLKQLFVLYLKQLRKILTILYPIMVSVCCHVFVKFILVYVLVELLPISA